jgi:hypothetical protein
VAVVTPTTPAPSTPTRNTPILSVGQLETLKTNGIFFLYCIKCVVQPSSSNSKLFNIEKFPTVVGPKG